MKLLGETIRLFYDGRDGWPEGYYLEPGEVAIYDDYGKFAMDPAKTYETSKLGVLVLESGDMTRPETVSFTRAISNWLKNRQVSEIVVTVPFEKREEALDYIRAAGYYVTPR